MIGRAAQGRPWIFREIEYFLETGKHHALPTNEEIQTTTIKHVKDLYSFYGEERGLRVARKHISWYTKGLKNSAQFRASMNQIEDCNEQIDAIDFYFNQLKEISKFIPYDEPQSQFKMELAS